MMPEIEKGTSGIIVVIASEARRSTPAACELPEWIAASPLILSLSKDGPRNDVRGTKI